MIKWFVYIVLLLILIPWLSSAKIKVSPRHYAFTAHNINLDPSTRFFSDTTTKTSKKQQELDDKKKIKEVPKAKKQPKPEKVEEPNNAAAKTKTKRTRRPEGMERPPEIPRRNGN